jgi:hypothetical protein
VIGTGSDDVFSTVLEGASQVHARAVPWRLAEGCVSSIQSRYVVTIEIVIITHEHSTGARACMGRRYELLWYG